MFGVMKALVKNKYTGTIYPEHPRALDADRDRVGPPLCRKTGTMPLLHTPTGYTSR